MAGVFFAWDPSGILPVERVRAALHEMDYRGPDGRSLVPIAEGYVGHQHSHRTPQEVDVAQPIEQDGVWLSLDGRIDERDPLAEKLPGFDPGTTRSDAELLLAGYEEFGLDLLEHLVGVCSFALYDSTQERLLVVRDRVGLRELFYCRVGDAIVVASDTRPLLTCLGGDVRVEERKLAEYLEDSTFTPGLSFYEAIVEVPPGQVAIVDDGQIEHTTYWRPTETPLEGDPETIVSRLRSTIETAVRDRLRSVGPVATELSGGLDSTTVSAFASRGSGDRTHSAYSLVFERLGSDRLVRGERERMAAVADRYRLDHREIPIDERGPLGEQSAYEPYVLEGPVINPMANAFEPLYQQAADDGHAVLLTGEGGHFFDGRQTVYVDLLRQGKFREAFGKIREDDTSYSRLAWFLLVKLASTVGGRFPESRDFGLPSETLLAPSFQERIEAERFDWEPYPQSRYDLLINQDIDQLTFHSPYLDLLNADRRLALAHGVDLWHPLLDSRVIDLLYSIPKELLLRDGQVKHLLRAVSAGILPEIVVEAKLTPSFTPLLTTNLHDERERLHEYLLAGELIERGYVTADDLEATLDAFVDTARTDGDYGSWKGITHREVWRLYTLELWLRTLGNRLPGD